jgi:hypothetical protein
MKLIETELTHCLCGCVTNLWIELEFLALLSFATLIVQLNCVIFWICRLETFSDCHKFSITLFWNCHKLRWSRIKIPFRSINPISHFDNDRNSYKYLELQWNFFCWKCIGNGFFFHVFEKLNLTTLKLKSQLNYPFYWKFWMICVTRLHDRYETMARFQKINKSKLSRAASTEK